MYELAFGRRDHGFFVDVGAFHPTDISNTSCLAERGWSGLLIDPIPEHAQTCRLHYGTVTTSRHRSCGRLSQGDVDIHLSGPLTTANPQLQGEYHDVAWAAPS